MSCSMGETRECVKFVEWCRGRRNDRVMLKPKKEVNKSDYISWLAAISLAAAMLLQFVTRLCDSSGGSNRLGGSSGSSGGDRGTAVTVDLSLSAVAGDVAGLTAAVAGLAGGVQRAAVGSSAVAGDVAKLAAGVALHGLSLAITGEVVGATTLVASGRTASSEATAEASVSATGRAASSTSHSWVGAVAGKVAGQTTAVAASAGASTTQAQSRAVSLDVSKTLAVVALLGYGRVSEM